MVETLGMKEDRVFMWRMDNFVDTLVICNFDYVAMR